MSEFEEPKFTGSLAHREPQYVLLLGLMGSFLGHALVLGMVRFAIVRVAGQQAGGEPAPVEFVEVGANGEILPPEKVAVVEAPKPDPVVPAPDSPEDVAIAPSTSPTPSPIPPSPTPSPVPPSPTPSLVPSSVMQPRPKSPTRSATLPKSPVQESGKPAKASSRKEQNSSTGQVPKPVPPTVPIKEPPKQDPVEVAESDKKLSEGSGETVSSRGVIISKDHIPTGFKPGDVQSAILGITMSDEPVQVQSSSQFAKGEKFQVAVSLSVLCRQDGDRPICLVQNDSIRLEPGQTVSSVQLEFAKAILTSERITYRPSIQTSLQVPVLSSDWRVTLEVEII
ncbi:MAG: hypothetical protein HC860_04820 [Alkalinema sp. RU_4_3]|nr:hypothetical protein [Alkalinema sp. RU_4_3]